MFNPEALKKFEKVPVKSSDLINDRESHLNKWYYSHEENYFFFTKQVDSFDSCFVVDYYYGRRFVKDTTFYIFNDWRYSLVLTPEQKENNTEIKNSEECNLCGNVGSNFYWHMMSLKCGTCNNIIWS